MYTATMEALYRSWYRQNKYTQVFVTCFGWSGAYPMKTKGEAHKGLSLMAQQDRVLPTIIMDESKEPTLGTF